MPKPGSGGGSNKPGGSTAFTIIGLSEASDSGTVGDDLTNQDTSFTLTGTVDPTVTSFTLTFTGTVNGVPSTYTATVTGSGGTWSYTYSYPDSGNFAFDDGSVLVQASYTTVNPKNGKTQTVSATPYSFTIDSTAPDAPTGLSLSGSTLSGLAEALATVSVFDDDEVLIGTTTADGTGAWSYDIGSRTGTISASATDAAGNTSLFASVNVGAGNTAPDAVNDSVTTSEDAAVTVNVLGNDNDANGDPLTVTGVGVAGHGSVLLQTGGNIVYTPNANWYGTDTFTYTISDGKGGTDTATVTVTVTPVNDSPSAQNDSATTAEDTAVTIGVLGNDSDVENDPLAVSIASQAAHGTATVNTDGTITYTPGANYSGTDSFTYRVSDGQGGTATATVSLTITPVNDAPQATDDSASTTHDTAVIVSVLANDSDPDGDTLSVIGATNGTNGTVVVNPDKTITYTPDAGFFGTDTFSYTVSDGKGGTDTATVTVSVAAAPPPPPGGTSYTPDDPLYSDQWHLAMIGDIQRIWTEFTGAGTSVGVYDNGVEYTHEDLWANYDASKHVTVGGVVLDPAPVGVVTAEHGTAVAGVIAAADNSVGGVGIAFGASITGVNIFGGPADINGTDVSGFSQAVDQAWTFDIISNSWGTTPNFNHENDPAMLAALAGFETAVEIGRGGLGTIIVKAAGNNWDSAQEFLNVSRYTITVAAFDQDGDASWYTNRGANLLVSAPSSGSSADGDAGVLTTDLSGSAGYNAGLYTPDFGGTSSATPVVSGVVALMLDANPELGWRDVQSILAYSATRIGNPDPNATAPVPADSDGDGTADTTVAFPVEFFGWFYNGADSWNGGGLHFSEDYGFGGVDAYAATRMAEVWTLFGDAQVSANELSFTGNMQTPALAFDNAWVSSSYSYAGPQMELEYVEVYVDFKSGGGLLDLYGNMEDVSVEIVSPSGTVVSLMQASNGYDSTNNYLNPLEGMESGGRVTWTYGVNALRGESVTGDWTVRIVDIDDGFLFDGGTLNAFQFSFYGATPNQDDVYHYTDEVFGILADPAEAVRLNLADASGIDWLDMAAMTGDLTVDLASDGTGGASAAGSGAFLAIANGTTIENAVTGDGGDVLIGNGAANELHGMRGDDTLDGGGGGDLLWGGAGDDMFLFHAGDGADWIGDFTAGGTEDAIAFYGTGYSFATLQMFDIGDGVLIDLGAGDQITLAGVFSVGDLTGDDFLFYA